MQPHRAPSAPVDQLEESVCCGRHHPALRDLRMGAEGGSLPARWVYDDGGRAAAGFVGSAPGDCFARAVAVATQRPYAQVYAFVNEVAKDMKQGRVAAKRAKADLHRRLFGSLGDARRGVHRPLFHEVMHRMGWSWTPTMRYGGGCVVHLRAEELPPGRIICRVTRHMVAVVDGVIHDTHDPSRGGTRCVYGYFSFADTSGPRPLTRCASASSMAPAVWPEERPYPVLALGAAGPQESPTAGVRCAPRRRVSHGTSFAAAGRPCFGSDDDSDWEVRKRCRRKRIRIAQCH